MAIYLSFLQKLYHLAILFFFMAQGPVVVRKGVRGHIVTVAASERFVPENYTGKDPRTKARHRKR